MKQIAQNYKSGELDRPRRAGSGVPSRRRARAVAVLADLHRHRDDEGHRGQACRWSARRGRGRTRCARSWTRCTQQGAVTTYKKVMNRLDSYTPLGYSLCGVVIEVGAGRRGVQGRPARRRRRATSTRCTPSTTGSRSTCARRSRGASRPSTPRSPPSAPIAMHGVRRAEVQLGETACVIGLGLVGQLVVRLLVAAGVRRSRAST